MISILPLRAGLLRAMGGAVDSGAESRYEAPNSPRNEVSLAGGARRYAASVARAFGAALPGVAERLAAADGLDAGAATVAEWQQKVQAWNVARDRLRDRLAQFLLGGLPELPGLGALAEDVDWSDAEGLQGTADIGPLHLQFASSALVIEPPPAVGGEPIVIGPFRPGSIGAAIKPPLGGGAAPKLPGGGDVLRLPDESGFGGRLQLPLGPVAVDATALLARLPDGSPSFLTVIGVAFTPPIQLSFGFSLDRVGGIVGVNRRMNSDALMLAVRTRAGGDALFATNPPASAAALVGELERFFPGASGSHVIGPTLRLSWLSFGEAGSFVSLDLGVVLELPSAKVAVLGVVRAGIPSVPGVIQLRIDVFGLVDPGAQLVSIDGSLVDSGLLKVFSIYGDAAARISWGGQAYTVLSIGGFYPGFNPEPARLPALRRVGMAMQTGFPGLTLRVEGYFAATSNTLQLGGRFEASFELGLEAHGFLQVDALVQFRPFHFEARCAAGFDVGVDGFTFGGVRLEGTIGGPGPVVIRGRLTIETFLFDISWDETFTLGEGPGDVLARPPELLDVFEEELKKSANLHAEQDQDPAVVMRPRPGRRDVAAVPPTGTLRWAQGRAPMALRIDRVDGQPLQFGQQGVTMEGAPVKDRFSPGSFCNLTDAEALNRPRFEILQAGVVLSPPAPAESLALVDDREVDLIVIRDGEPEAAFASIGFDLSHVAELVLAARRPPALSEMAPLVVAHEQRWRVSGPFPDFDNATAAHQLSRTHIHGLALAREDF